MKTFVFRTQRWLEIECQYSGSCMWLFEAFRSKIQTAMFMTNTVLLESFEFLAFAKNQVYMSYSYA